MNQIEKLVRDNIPEIIFRSGGDPFVRTASPEEIGHLLRRKLEEEVTEFLASGELEELADIVEVIHALLHLDGQDFPNLERIREDKLRERGGFSSRIVLLSRC